MAAHTQKNKKIKRKRKELIDWEEIFSYEPVVLNYQCLQSILTKKKILNSQHMEIKINYLSTYKRPNRDVAIISLIERIFPPFYLSTLKY